MVYTLIHNGTLIDGNGGKPLQEAAVLVEDSRIRSVGPMRSITLPDSNVTQLNAQGGYILPGFIDTHVHIMLEIDNMLKMMATPFSLNFYKAVGYMQRTIEAGITTVRDAGGADL